MERKYVWVVTEIPIDMVTEPILTVFDNDTAARKMYEERTRLRDSINIILDKVPVYHKYIVE